jgi:chromate transporter
MHRPRGGTDIMTTMNAPALPPTAPPEAPDEPSPVVSPGRLFRLWASIGAQSFGGGMATSALIRQTFVERLQWISDEEFAREQTLCTPVPGMNLLALTILIGHRLDGMRGVYISLLGLLLPSVTLGILITAFFSHLRGTPNVQAALKNGVVPAAVGIGLYSVALNGVALLRASRREGTGAFLLDGVLMLGGIALTAWTHLPVFLLLLAAGAAGAGMSLLQTRRQPVPETEEVQP